MINKRDTDILLKSVSAAFSEGKSHYDKALLEELESDGLELINEDVIDLVTNEIRYKDWSLQRNNHLISKISHLPLLVDTIFQLDLAGFNLLLKHIRNNKDDVLFTHSLQLRSSSLSHKDFQERFSAIVNSHQTKNLQILLFFNNKYDNHDETFKDNFQLIKTTCSKVILDSFGCGAATPVLYDMLDFDGIKVHSSIKMLHERQSLERVFLMKGILKQIKADGNLIVSPLILSNEIKRFYVDMGCECGVIL
ncbi:EAL domain-containing protein [Photobacterium sp. GB-72]|uniref:EAL domain-containing protein n=1 Tax=Photobacterium sp. GB-72 TaxID=2022105 RepID=UPI000D167E95|nr:EAL domain-containing protein [Photobacterium sp. GB-72]PSV27624.1 hypothetical protein C9J40_20020 [Photobacterium sp. GB-72]